MKQALKRLTLRSSPHEDGRKRKGTKKSQSSQSPQQQQQHEQQALTESAPKLVACSFDLVNRGSGSGSGSWEEYDCNSPNNNNNNKSLNKSCSSPAAIKHTEQPLWKTFDALQSPLKNDNDEHLQQEAGIGSNTMLAHQIDFSHNEAEVEVELVQHPLQQQQLKLHSISSSSCSSSSSSYIQRLYPRPYLRSNNHDNNSHDNNNINININRQNLHLSKSDGYYMQQYQYQYQYQYQLEPDYNFNHNHLEADGLSDSACYGLQKIQHQLHSQRPRPQDNHEEVEVVLHSSHSATAAIFRDDEIITDYADNLIIAQDPNPITTPQKSTNPNSTTPPLNTHQHQHQNQQLLLPTLEYTNNHTLAPDTPMAVKLHHDHHSHTHSQSTFSTLEIPTPAPLIHTTTTTPTTNTQSNTNTNLDHQRLSPAHHHHRDATILSFTTDFLRDADVPLFIYVPHDTHHKFKPNRHHHKIIASPLLPYSEPNTPRRLLLNHHSDDRHEEDAYNDADDNLVDHHDDHDHIDDSANDDDDHDHSANDHDDTSNDDTNDHAEEQGPHLLRQFSTDFAFDHDDTDLSAEPPFLRNDNSLSLLLSPTRRTAKTHNI